MKKLIYCALALAAGLFATSCMQENLEPVQEGSTVTYTVNVPEVATKAIGEGSMVDQLVYAVYRIIDAENLTDEKLQEAKANITEKCQLVYQKTQNVAGKTSTIVPLELINNQRYIVLFWAQNTDAWFDDAKHNLGSSNIAYPSGYQPNNDKYDAFTNVDYIEVNGAASKNITLTRPFGQLNIATNLPSTFTAEVNTTTVSVMGLAHSYNVATKKGSVTVDTSTSTPTPVPFAPAAPLKDDQDAYLEFGNYARYISMNYVFVEDEQANVAVTYDIETTHGNVSNTINSVPVKKNYKTNIVGNLLTSNVDYNVTIEKDWSTPENVVEIWDGETITRPEFKDNTWIVKTGAELAWIAQAVNKTLPTTISTEVEYSKDHVISLGDNIRLGGHEWIPIGTKASHFMGIFDGNGYFIEDFAITKHHDNAPDAHYAALFGTVSGKPTIKELTIQKAKIVYPGEGDFYGSGLIGTAYGNVTIENVTVKDSYISGNNKVAGILAHDGVMNSLNINNCHVLYCTIESLNQKDGGNVGGLVGLYNSGVESTISNSSVKNCTINGINSTNTGKRSNGEFVGCIGGKDNAVLKIIECEISTNTFTQNEGVTYVSPYGVFVGGNRDDNGKGTVIVDGKYMFDNGFTKEGNTIKVSNASHFLKAIAMVEDNDVITLLGNVTFTETNRTHNSGTYFDGLYYIGDKNFTIDLGGKTITQDGAVNDYLLNFKNAGSKANTITIKNGTINAGTTAFCAICTSSVQDNQLTINTENVDIINNISNGSTIKLRGGAVLNVENGTKITGIDSYLGIECVASTVNIYNGAEIYMNGTTSYCGCLVGACGGGTVNVYGGYGKGVKGGFIAMTSGGTINVSGGEWIANTDGTVGDNSNLYVLTAQSNKYESGFVGGAYINVTGGTFRGGMDAWVLNNVPEEKAELNIMGGNFNANPATYVVDGYEAKNDNGFYVVSKKPEATVNGTPYVGTFAEAVASAKSGDTITVIDDVTLTEALTLPAGIVFNGNGKQIEGTISAAGDLTLEGHTKVTSFSAGFSGNTITIKKGACLEVTGSGRTTFGYANTFDIKGELTDAKTADKTKIQPSLIIPAGLSVTGGNGFTLNVKDAYVQIGSTTSKNSAANGIFTLNIENSIAEFTNQLTFAEPTSGKNPTFNLNIKNSVVTMGTKLIAAAPGCNIKVDNSTVKISSYFRNSGKFELVNGSVLTGSTIQFGENGGNDGETIVDNSKFTIKATSADNALDGKGNGKIIAKNNATVSVDYYKAMTIDVDETSTFTGTKVQ